LGNPDKRVAAANTLIFSGATDVLERSGASYSVALVLPRAVRLIAIRISDNAVAASFVLLVVEVSVKERGTFHTGPMEGTTFALVIKKGAAELTHPVKMALLDLMGFADPKPTEFSDYLPILGVHHSRYAEAGTNCECITQLRNSFHWILPQICLD
jgi:hypothetical protein